MEFHQTFSIKYQGSAYVCCFKGKPRLSGHEYAVHDGTLHCWLRPEEAVDVTVFHKEPDVKAASAGLRFVQQLIARLGHGGLKTSQWWTPAISELDYRFWTRKSSRTLKKRDIVLVQLKIPGEESGCLVEYGETPEQMCRLRDHPLLAKLVSDSVQHSGGRKVISSMTARLTKGGYCLKHVTLRPYCKDKDVSALRALFSGLCAQPSAPEPDFDDHPDFRVRLTPTAPEPEVREGRELVRRWFSCPTCSSRTVNVYSDPFHTYPPPPYSETDCVAQTSLLFYEPPPPYSDDR